jgi:uncharacterized BrkB/YihY/UPF0761 family membrane protein
MDPFGSVVCGVILSFFALFTFAFIHWAVRRKIPAKIVWQGIGALAFVCCMAVAAAFIAFNINNNFDGTRSYPGPLPPSIDQP